MAGRKANRKSNRGKGKNAKKAPKKATIKKVQFKTEYKDRVSSVHSSTLSTNPAPWDPFTHSPQNSQILMPHSFLANWSQGTSNGQIDGNQINARFLNMKVELDFSDLPTVVRSEIAVPPNVQVYHDQNYHIVIRQCLILDDISEHLNKTYTNSNSGRTQPAFDGITAGSAPIDLVTDLTRRALNRQLVKSDFLSYQRRQDTKVRVLKKITVKGNLNKRFTTENVVATQVKIMEHDEADATYNLLRRPYPTPNQMFSFNWKMPKEKMTLQPVIGTNSALQGHWPGKSWIPCVLVTCERDTVDVDLATHPLRIKQISHFTYTDN
jgi:hypothetical protein